MGLSHLASLFDHPGRVTMGQADQPHHHANTVNATLLQNAFRPAPGVSADRAGFVQPPGGAALNPAALLGNNVSGVGGESPRLVLGMNGDLPELLIEQPHDASIPACPDGA